MNEDRLPPNTIATLAHGRTTVQAWWRYSARTASGWALSWGVDGEDIDHNRVADLVEVGDPAAATLVGLWAMTAPKDGGAGHVTMPWRLTEYGKDMAQECPCGPCAWTDPPERVRRKATPPKAVNARMRREARRERRRAEQRRIAAILEAQARRIRELEADREERDRREAARFADLRAQLRAELEVRVAADVARIQAREARRGGGGTFRKAGAPAPSAEAVREKRVEAGKARAAGAARVGGRFVKKGT